MKKTGIIAIILMGIIAIGAALYLGMSFTAQTMATFSESGYVLVPEALNSDAKQQTFLSGTTYKSGTGDVFVFQNDLGEEVVVTEDTFLHYTDGSISSMAQGVIAKMDEIENVGFMNYYALSPQTVLRASADGYTVDNQGVALEFTDFIWKISDNKFMIVSDSVDVHFSADDVRTVSGFVEVSYVDDSVVRIQTEENLWQTISPNCYATLADGKVVNFNNRLVADSAGNSIFHLTNMVINADDNIPIYNQAEVEAQELKVPEFDIKVEDGADGVAGLEGTSGEIGLDGEEGEKGEEGDEGEQGDDGDEGDSGSAGSSGSSGSSGSDGSTGVTGGTAGSTGDGSTEEEEEESTIPVFVLDDWLVGADSISCYIAAESNIEGLAEVDKPWIYIYEESTSRLVYGEQYDFYNEAFNGSLPQNSFDPLQPDTQYRLVVYGSYMDGGKEYKKDFISKTFYTDSSGINFNAMYSTENSLTFEVTKEPFSTVATTKLYMFESEAEANAFENSDEDEFLAEISVDVYDEQQTIDLANGGFFAADAVLSDKTYYFRAVCITEDNQSVLLNPVYSMKTLKREVTSAVNDDTTVDDLTDKLSFEKVGPTAIETKATYSFDVYPSITDLDNAVTKCSYYVYYASELTVPVKQTPIVQYNTDMVSIPLASYGLAANTEYVIQMEVEYYDNEKTVTITSDFSNSVSMVGGEMPTVSFAFANDENGNPTGSNATTSGAVATSYNHDSIKGNIFLSNSVGGSGSNTSADIVVGETQPVTISVSAAGVYNNVWTYTSSTSTNGVIEIPVSLMSLQQTTSYIFTVSAYVNFNDGGDVKSVTLGSFAVQTTTAPTTNVSMYSNAQNLDSFGVTILLSDYEVKDDSGTVTETISAEASMQKAEMMEVTLYSSDKKTIIGTPVTIWDTSESDSPESYDTSLCNSSFATDYYNKAFYISSSEFKGNLTSDGYWVDITKFYDYTYETVYTAGSGLGEEYIDTFVNELPVTGTTSVYVRITDQPPNDPDNPGGGVEATPIKNGEVEDYGGTKDGSLPDDSIVGYLLSSTYDNSSALGLTVQYHAFENNSYKNFNANANSYSGAIYDWTNTSVCEVGAIKDPITANLALYATPEIDFVQNKVPEVVFLFEDAGDREQGALAPYSGSAVRYVYYTGEFVSDGNVGVSTGDSGISRGMQLQFAYTVGLSTNASTEVEKYYPYCVWESAGETFTTTSYVQDVPKSNPLMYAYPWSSSNAFADGRSFATWRYWLCDLDDSVVESSPGKANWLRDGFTYVVSGDTVLPGNVKVGDASAAMTASQFATYEYGGAGSGDYATMTLSTGAAPTSADGFGYVAIPLENKGVARQMAVDVELYRKDIYGDDLSGLDKNYCLVNGDGEILTQLPLFRIYDSMPTVPNVASLPAPVWDLNSEYNTYSIDFGNVFDNRTSGSVEANLYDRLAGVYLTFEAADGTTLNLYKTLNGEDKVSGKTSELATVAGQTVTINMKYVYASNTYGFYSAQAGFSYSVRSFDNGGEPVIRNYTSSVTGDEIPSYWTAIGDELKISAENAPAMGSLFTPSAAYLSLGSEAVMQVYARESKNLVGGITAKNQVNMGYFGSADQGVSYYTPIGNGFAGSIDLATNQKINYTVPLVNFDTGNAFSELESITMSGVTFSGASSNNIGNKIYFKVEYAEEHDGSVVVPGYEDMQALLLSNGADAPYDVKFENLAIDEKYVVTVYAYQNGGVVHEDNLVQLLDETKSSTPKAVYYLNTLQEVEIDYTSSTPRYIVNGYWNKYVQVNYTLSTISGFDVTYKLYNCEEEDLEDYIKAGNLPYYENPETLSVKESNAVQVGFGPYGYIQEGELILEEDHKQLPMGTYTFVIEATSKVVVDENGKETGGEVLGKAIQEFEVENYASPTAVILPTETVSTSTASDGSVVYTHGATIMTIIKDSGCQLTAGDVKEYDTGVSPYGDYVVYVYEKGESNYVYSSGVQSTYGGNYFYPTNLKPDTTYEVVVYAIKDANEDGEDDAGTDLLSLRQYMAADDIAEWRNTVLTTSESDLPDYVFAQTAEFTTNEDTTVVYKTATFAIKNGNIGIRFTGASGLNGGFGRIQYDVYYIDDNYDGQWTRATIENPTFELENSGTGTYWLKLTEVIGVENSAYCEVTATYDYGDDGYDGTWNHVGALPYNN